ncbi:hypothetical protein KSS87_004079 [Heliosperma pusillum]|nr:hypothetical protein KSS87_004079 [Heliosperma pusillum]
MERIGSDIEMEKQIDEQFIDEHDEETQLLKDRFNLSAISIAQSQGPLSLSLYLFLFFSFDFAISDDFIGEIFRAAKEIGMEISEPIVACISNLAFNYAEHLAKDLELFAHHAGRKLVNTEDVILAAHRNENLSQSLRTFCNDLKAKEPQTEKRRKKARKEDKATTSTFQTIDL